MMYLLAAQREIKHVAALAHAAAVFQGTQAPLLTTTNQALCNYLAARLRDAARCSFARLP